MGGSGGRNIPPDTPYADILLLTLNYTSPPNFIQIGSKLPVSYSGWISTIKAFGNNPMFKIVDYRRRPPLNNYSP